MLTKQSQFSNSERTLYALRFAHANPQMTAVHPNYTASVISQCNHHLVVCSVDSYRETCNIIRTAGFKKMNLAASGNAITIYVERK